MWGPWLPQSLRLLGSDLRGHDPDCSRPRWVSATARTTWLMSGPNTRMWMGTSTRYLRGAGEWEEVPIALGGSGFSLKGPEAASLTPTWA